MLCKYFVFARMGIKGSHHSGTYDPLVPTDRFVCVDQRFLKTVGVVAVMKCEENRPSHSVFSAYILIGMEWLYNYVLHQHQWRFNHVLHQHQWRPTPASMTFEWRTTPTSMTFQVPWHTDGGVVVGAVRAVVHQSAVPHQAIVSAEKKRNNIYKIRINLNI